MPVWWGVKVRVKDNSSLITSNKVCLTKKCKIRACKKTTWWPWQTACSPPIQRSHSPPVFSDRIPSSRAARLGTWRRATASGWSWTRICRAPTGCSGRCWTERTWVCSRGCPPRPGPAASCTTRLGAAGWLGHGLSDPECPTRGAASGWKRSGCPCSGELPHCLKSNAKRLITYFRSAHISNSLPINNWCIIEDL